MARIVPRWDGSLLAGVRFQCRPNCALCCFATPSLAPAEKERLLRIEPELPLVEDDGWTGIAAAARGGACGLLTDRRCRRHADRPSPCRLYPLHVHLGSRVQASVVLSCPGVETSWLPAAGTPATFGPTSGDGLEAERGWLDRLLASDGMAEELELARANVEMGHDPSGAPDAAASERELRARLGAAPPLVRDSDFPPVGGPSAEDGLELLPLFQDPTHGTVAIAAAELGFDLLRVDPRGGAEVIATYPGLMDRPTLTPEGRATLQAYLGYLVARDAIADTVRLEWLDAGAPGSLEEAWRAELRRDAAIVLERSYLRALLGGRAGRTLDAEDIGLGIRATDADLLDRPGLGLNL